MKFSVCIPNFNYARFVGRTIESVLAQTYGDFEVLISDNASTDDSLAVARSFTDPRIRIHVNNCNVGFAGNLDRAAGMAGGERLLMLSSDDMMLPAALETYSRLETALGARAERAIFCSACQVIDAQDSVTGRIDADPVMWANPQQHDDLTQAIGAPVFSLDAEELLRRSLRQLKNPLSFLATCYPRTLYQRVEGYGGNRMTVPDKWFHWKLLAQADRAYFVNQSLFAYRWHANNQGAQEAGMAALKLMVDQYAATLELESSLLDRLAMNRQQVCDAFVEYDVGRHGLATLARRQRKRAARILTFGRAVYPDLVRQNRKCQILAILVRLGVLGERLAERAYARYLDKAAPNNHKKS